MQKGLIDEHEGKLGFEVLSHDGLDSEIRHRTAKNITFENLSLEPYTGN